MSKPKYFKSKTAGKIRLPVFFPDATKGVVRTLDSKDIENTKTEGLLVNTYHLFKHPGKKIIEQAGGIRKYMSWRGAVISDSGGFQVGSLVKKNPKLGKVTDKGVFFKFPGEKATMLTPELSIDFQMSLDTDMLVVLDDFTPPDATHIKAKETVERTLLWAERSKKEFERLCRLKSVVGNDKPYLIGVVQGGNYQDLRKYCTEKLVEIGFDGLGYGGWPIVDNKLDLQSAFTIKENAPDNYFLYGLGIGKPEDIVSLVDIGYNIFDCVLPTRDARHKRLYTYNYPNIKSIDLTKKDFYSFYFPDKEKYKEDFSTASTACDCLLCTNYSRAYLCHLFKENEVTALRLSTIHNLRFYAILMDKIRNK